MQPLISITKIVFLPTTAIAIFLLVGLLLTLYRPFRRAGLLLSFFGFILLLLFANGPFSYWLLGNLEYQYKPIDRQSLTNDIAYIAVLSGYATDDSIFPLSSRVNDSTLFRIVEAVTLWKKRPSTTILLAGPQESATVMAQLMNTLGVHNKSIQILPPSINTFENVQTISEIVMSNDFVLVTSAGHMPRAMILCKQFKLNAIPAPTDYLTTPYILAASWYPKHEHLKCSDLAVHELTALLYYRYFQNRH